MPTSMCVVMETPQMTKKHRTDLSSEDLVSYVPTEVAPAVSGQPADLLELKKWQNTWLKVVENLGRHSSLFREAENSEKRDAHIRRAFSLKASTLRKPWAGWHRFCLFCSDLHISPGEVSPAELADFASLLVDADEEEEEPENPAPHKVCSGPSAWRSSLHALRFVANKAGV